MSPGSTKSSEATFSSSSSSDKSFLSSLVERMNPRACLGIHYENNQDFDVMVETILKDLKDPNTSKRALERLYDATDLTHQYNRIPMVCTSQWDMIDALAACLANDEERRFACLTLNNLSIPFENKAVMAFGPSSDKLLNAVLQVIQQGHKESYLCCILLLNISFLDDAKLKLLEYNGGLDNPKSLLRTMELVLKIYSRFLKKSVLSVEGEAVKYSTGLLRNLTSIEPGACMVAKTRVPKFLLSFIRDSTRPLHLWTKDSLEDAALQTLVNMATYEDSCTVLKKMGAQHAFDSIIDGKGGIHDVRASFLQVHLQ